MLFLPQGREDAKAEVKNILSKAQFQQSSQVESPNGSTGRKPAACPQGKCITSDKSLFLSGVALRNFYALLLFLPQGREDAKVEVKNIVSKAQFQQSSQVESSNGSTGRKASCLSAGQMYNLKQKSFLQPTLVIYCFFTTRKKIL